MATLQVKDISLAYADRDLLTQVGFTIDSTTRAALAGANGSGKSTLMKIVCGQVQSDGGTIAATKGMRISYLPQSDIVLGDHSVYEETETAFERFQPVLDEIAHLEERLAGSDQTGAHEALLVRHHELQEQLLASSYWQRTAVIEQILTGLGFDRNDIGRPCREFSGGWQMRIALAKVLAEDPDIMLLDEPTNYLDIEARIWLKNYLKQYEGGLLIVSHDQGFLDETINEVYELFNARLTRYSGTYSSYLVQREQELERLEAAYRLQMQQIEKTEQFIERFRYKATKAKQVQSRAKQLDKIEVVQIPAHLRKLSFSFPPAPHSGNDVVVVEHLSKHYGDLHVFDDFSLMVNKRDRLAVTGRNGAGKSTLLRMMAGFDPDFDGRLALGTNVSVGYFAQDTEKTLNPTLTVLQEAESVAATADIPRLRNLLGSFLFSDDDVFKQVAVLSGGERSRLALLKILLKPANLLILDEPTNHLDINAKQMLLEALQAYDGTIVFVSHDTHFIKHLATRILYLCDGQRPETFEGDYEYFSWKLEQKEQVERIGKPTPSREVTATFDRREANRAKNRLRKLRQEADELLQRSAQLELQLAEIVKRMQLPENYSDRIRIGKLVAERDGTQQELDRLAQQWFLVHETIEDEENGNVL